MSQRELSGLQRALYSFPYSTVEFLALPISPGVETCSSTRGKGSLEYSSTTVRKYLILEALGNGPLKSKFSRSKTCVALISQASFERTKCGFTC